MKESDLLAHIFQLSGGINAGAGDVLVGPGDDCAVVRTASGDVLLLTVDQVVEGRHFEVGTPIDLIARKAVARSISDIAAMGGEPAWGLATGLLPDGFAEGMALSEALHRWGRHWRCPIVGGDIAFGPGPLSITVTVVGRMSDASMREYLAEAIDGGRDGVRPVLRSGAQPGDELWLTGPVGGAVRSGRHLLFEPRLEIGQAAGWSMNGVHAMIDLSDGLGRDAARIGVASSVRLEIEASRVPLAEGCDDWRRAVSEGEDYELLIVGGIAGSNGKRLTGASTSLVGPIGIVRACGAGEGPGATIIDPHGRAHDAAELGWDHGV